MAFVVVYYNLKDYNLMVKNNKSLKYLLVGDRNKRRHHRQDRLKVESRLYRINQVKNEQLTKQRIVIILGNTTEGWKETEEFSGATGSIRGHNS